MDPLSLVKTILDKIPEGITVVRSLIIKILEVTPFPADSSYMIVAGIAALFIAYYWFKNYVTYNVFFKLSTFLNYLLFALLLFLVFTRVQ